MAANEFVPAASAVVVQLAEPALIVTVEQPARVVPASEKDTVPVGAVAPIECTVKVSVMEVPGTCGDVTDDVNAIVEVALANVTVVADELSDA